MTILRATSASLLAAGLLFGCSPVEDHSNSTDAAVDATDTEAPMIMSASPANMGHGFSVIAPLTVMFAEAVDPATVSATTVRLEIDQTPTLSLYLTSNFFQFLGASKAAPRGTVAYDQVARRLTYTPQRPLAYGTHYTLVLSGVKDLAGNELTTKISFVTAVNGVIRVASFNPSYQVNGYTLFPTDMNGFMRRQAPYSPGNDTFWFTNDDVANSAFEFTYDDVGRMTSESLLAAGNDSKFNTPDDVQQTLISLAYTADGVLTERVFHSVATDPAIQLLIVFTATGSRLTGSVLYTDAGGDMGFRTPDDKCTNSRYFDWTYDASGNRTRETLRNCGSDALPRTADDATLYVNINDYEYDVNGDVTLLAYHNGPGGDTNWLTPDDSFSVVERFTYDASGLLQITSFMGAGNDTLWLSPDDVVVSQVRQTYNANKQPIEIVTYVEDGTNNIWDGTDDVIGSIQTFSYDANGNRTDSKTWDKGPDLLWRTPDDRIVTDYDYDLLH